MRGVFTVGVLDAFMDAGLAFPYIVAVSAGAGNGLSYVSGQRGRARRSNIEMLTRYHYVGWRHLLRRGSMFDAHFLYDRLPNEVLPFDYAAFFANPCTFEMVATDCRTARPVYLQERSSRTRLLAIAEASAALPYVGRIKHVDGVPLLDGGIVDNIPVARAQATGHTRLVAVLTRNLGYRTTGRHYAPPFFLYRQYPALRRALTLRLERYNDNMATVERLEREGRVLCVRPQLPVAVGRMDTDPARLTALYNEGLEQGRRAVAELGARP